MQLDKLSSDKYMNKTSKRVARKIIKAVVAMVVVNKDKTTTNQPKKKLQIKSGKKVKSIAL
jgi:hypothetical protein